MAQEIGLTARITPEVDDGALKKETDKMEKRVRQKAKKMAQIRDIQQAPATDKRAADKRQRRVKKAKKGLDLTRRAVGTAVNPPGPGDLLKKFAKEDGLGMPSLPNIPNPFGGSGGSGGVGGTTASEPGDTLGVLQAQLGVQEEILETLQDMHEGRFDNPAKKDDEGGKGRFSFLGGAGGAGGTATMMAALGLGTIGAGAALGLDTLEDFEWPDPPSIPPLELPDIPDLGVPDIPTLEVPPLEVPDIPALEVPEIQPLEIPGIPPLEIPDIPALEVPDVVADFPIPIPVGKPGETGTGSETGTGTGSPDPSAIVNGIAIGEVLRQAWQLLKGGSGAGAGTGGGATAGAGPVAAPSMMAGQWLERKKREIFGDTDMQSMGLASASSAVASGMGVQTESGGQQTGGGSRENRASDSGTSIEVPVEITIEQAIDGQQIARDAGRQAEEAVKRELDSLGREVRSHL